MRCPYCDADNDRVLDSRASEDGRSIRRRRICNHCHRRFTTYERVEESTIAVIKKGSVREPFSREKISRGLERACWKRPISAEQIRKIVSMVEAEIYQEY
jgi:transcriptional repressor NrdR